MPLTFDEAEKAHHLSVLAYEKKASERTAAYREYERLNKEVTPLLNAANEAYDEYKKLWE